jgi:hypothetical protein
MRLGCSLILQRRWEFVVRMLGMLQRHPVKPEQTRRERMAIGPQWAG